MPISPYASIIALKEATYFHISPSLWIRYIPAFFYSPAVLILSRPLPSLCANNAGHTTTGWTNWNEPEGNVDSRAGGFIAANTDFEFLTVARETEGREGKVQRGSMF